MIITFVGHSHLEKTDEILSGIKKCIIDNIEAVEKEERIFFIAEVMVILMKFVVTYVVS